MGTVTCVASVVARQEADRLINYGAERRDMINYPEFVEQGWQFSSGATESR